MSGHSRWAQVKHKKAASDAKRSQLFSKLAREITIAARDGGDNPEANSRLRMAIARARSEGVPKENIERAIGRAKGGGDTAMLQEFLYEATAPDGTMILVEGITDNKQRTLAELRQIFLAHHLRLADPGSVVWNFEKIGSALIPKAENATRPDEEIELALMDAGAEEIVPFEDGWVAETKLNALDELRRGIEAKGIIVAEVNPEFKARDAVAPDAARRKEIDMAMEELREHNDVQEVYSNMALPATPF